MVHLIQYIRKAEAVKEPLGAKILVASRPTKFPILLFVLESPISDVFDRGCWGCWGWGWTAAAAAAGLLLNNIVVVSHLAIGKSIGSNQQQQPRQRHLRHSKQTSSSLQGESYRPKKRHLAKKNFDMTINRSEKKVGPTNTTCFFLYLGPKRCGFAQQDWPASIDLIKGQMRDRGRNSPIVPRSGGKEWDLTAIETSTGGTGWLQRVAATSQVQ